MNTNLNKLIKLMEERAIDAVGITPGPNLSYFTGLNIKKSERVTFILVFQDGSVVSLVPQVEQDKFEKNFEGQLIVYKDEEGPSGALSELQRKYGSDNDKMAVEHRNCNVTEWKMFSEMSSNLINADTLINQLRLQKSSEEVIELKKAAQILEESFKESLGFIDVGRTELEVAAKLEYELKIRGSSAPPFETIVASGPRGASPHGRASHKKIKNGELVVMDFGSRVNGYVGDICRTIGIGEISKENEKIYEVVKEAQQYAVETVRPGVTAHDVDEAARSVIESYGYGEYFTHRTGHGLGVDAHEEPYIMQNNNTVLEPGMVFSIEPGIYIPDKAGVRIEDTILVTQSGYENLMNLEKDLIII